MLLLFPSCIRYYKLSKSEFPQGVEHEDTRDITHNYVRSGRALDQFSTLAAFNALWLSNDTREAYVDVYSRRRGKDDAKHDAMLKRQLEENKHWVSFYILTDIRDATQYSMSDKNSTWTVYLEIERKKDLNKIHCVTSAQELEKAHAPTIIKLEPISIKEIDVEPEYQEFFGKHRFNLFKDSYLVKFPVSDLEGKPYVQKGDIVTMVFGSAQRDVRLVWDTSDTKKHGELRKDEDFYWI